MGSLSKVRPLGLPEGGCLTLYTPTQHASACSTLQSRGPDRAPQVVVHNRQDGGKDNIARFAVRFLNPAGKPDRPILTFGKPARDVYTITGRLDCHHPKQRLS